MIDQQGNTVDDYGRPSTIAGWLQPQKQPKIQVIKSPAEGAVMKILALKR